MGTKTGRERIDIGAFELPGAFVVSNSIDENDGNYSSGHLSLREALALAAVRPGTDTITFASSLFSSGPATITLSLGELTLDSNVTITGPGAGTLSISGNNLTRVFEENAGVTATIKDLKITGGNTNAGGGIFASGSLTLDHATVFNNTATSQGGGIYLWNTGYLSLVDSTVDGNHAGASGGGIFVYAGAGHVLDVSRSTISNNTANGIGGLDFMSSGGTNIGTIVDSTISGNSASSYIGGIRVIFAGAHLDITNTTIANNTGTTDIGGLQLTQGGTATLNNTIVADNHGNVTGNISGSVDASSSNNLVTDWGSGGLTNNNNGNIVLTYLQSTGLGSLGDYGGSTKTMPLLATTSPAINHGSNAKAIDAGSNALLVDQRSFARNIPSGGTVDIGAFEFAAPIVVSTLVDESDGNISSGDLSLREALALAAAIPGADKITFASSLFSSGPATITLSLGELTLDSNVTITGPGADKLSISANNQTGVFYENSGVTATLSGVKITGGNTNAGGGIFASGSLTLDHATVAGNTVTSTGGGIFVSNTGYLSLIDSTVDGNHAGASGGGIFVYAGAGHVLDVSRSTISNNTANGIGGLDFMSSGGTNIGTIVDSTISGNSASSYIGGIRVIFAGTRWTSPTPRSPITRARPTSADCN